MAIYAIGDIQGCFEPFQQLLRLIDFNPGKDTLWLTGDLVNRGPQSLEVLRWVFQHQDQVEMVLGNHDLHLLAVSEGFGKIHRDDTIDDVLNAADGKVLLDWLRCQPMMLEGHGYAMVHAGLLPEWTISKALRLAEEVEFGLSGTRYREFLGRLYGNKPTRWTDDLKGVDRLRLIVNVMTRMRFLTRDGELDLSYKGELEARRPIWCPGSRRRTAAMAARPSSAGTGRRWACIWTKTSWRSIPAVYGAAACRRSGWMTNSFSRCLARLTAKSRLQQADK